MSTSGKNKLANNVVLIVTWLVTIVYTGGYLLGYNVFPIADWLQRVYDPVYEWLFGRTS